jgi:hypothetical protein
MLTTATLYHGTWHLKQLLGAKLNDIAQLHAHLPGLRGLPGQMQNFTLEQRSTNRVQCIDGVSMYPNKRSWKPESKVLLA